jgi:eukaryotic-like serine/threonine-protein kinase
MNRPDEGRSGDHHPETGRHDGEGTNGTAHIDPELADLLARYEEALFLGESVSIAQFCRELPEREVEVRALLESMRDGAARLRAVPSAGKSNSSPAEETLSGNSLSCATRLSQLRAHARGGLGEVFRAFDEDLGRDVAVKVLTNNRPGDADTRERFLREAEVTGRLRHPGIVPVYGRGETLDRRPFYVMPFLEDGSLEKAINAFHEDRPTYRVDDPQFRDLLSRFVAACKTVAYAHSRGVVHRDLKPHNIMLGRYGETLVIDWGLAERSRREHRHRLTGEQSIEVRGSSSQSSSSGGFTPQYASPEQLDGTLEVGPASDVYSLGAMLYKLVCGMPPLMATTLGEMRQAGLRGDFPPPRERKKCVPRPLQAICLKALQTAPAGRYESPELLAADVEAFLADAPVSAFPEDLLSRASRVVRRQWPAVLAALASLLLIAMVSLVTALTQQGLKTDARESSLSRLQLAATLAAQAGGGEIDRRWRLLEVEAASPAVIDAVQELNEDPTSADARRLLQAHLTERYVAAHSVQNIRFHSLFVNGIRGEQFARVPRGTSIGRNFAFRHYFHGQRTDLPENSQPPPADHPVLSVVYISENTHTPHVSLTVPVWDQGLDAQRRVIGRVGMAISVGDLGMFRQLGHEEVPMLVETRKYGWGEEQSYGIVVHHPDFRSGRTGSGGKSASLPRLEATTVDTLIDRWRQEVDHQQESTALVLRDFVDPIGGGKAEAAFASVAIPWREAEIRNTGWMIILHTRRATDD